MRLLLALAWMRWRAFVNGVARRRKRSASQRLSGWLALGSTALVTMLGLLLAAILAAAGFGAGWALAAHGTADAQAGVGIGLRVLGFMALGMALLAPIQGAGEVRAPTRLLLLPVSRARLHLAAILASAVDPLVLLSVPASLALVAGLAAGGAPHAALVALPSAVAVALTIVGFDALVGFGSQLMLRDRRRGETFALIALLVLMAVGFLPALITGRVEDHGAGVHAEFVDAAQVEKGFGAFDALPPGLFARAVQRAVDGREAASLAHGAALGALALVLLGGAAAVHSRLLSEPGRTSRRRGNPAFPAREPSLRAPWLALAESSVRADLRTVKGKIATFTPPLVAGAMALVFGRMQGDMPLLASTLTSSRALFSWCVALTLLNQQQIGLNAYAADGPGFTLTCLLPASARDVVNAKLVAHALLFGIAIVPSIVVALLMGSASSPAQWIVAVLACATAFLLHAPVALLLSAWLPKPADLSKIQGQQPHPLATLLGTVALVGALLLSRGAARLAELVAGQAAAIGVAAACCIVALAAAPFTLRLAASLLEERREAIAMAAQRR